MHRTHARFIQSYAQHQSKYPWPGSIMEQKSKQTSKSPLRTSTSHINVSLADLHRHQSPSKRPISQPGGIRKLQRVCAIQPSEDPK